MLVTLPIGLWIFSLVSDVIFLMRWGAPVWSDVAFYTMAGGAVGALLAALPGLVDLLSIEDRTVKRLGLSHMIINLVVVALFAGNVWLRMAAAPGAMLPFALSVVGILLLGTSGWLGGEMVYVHGVGVEPHGDSRREERDKIRASRHSEMRAGEVERNDGKVRVDDEIYWYSRTLHDRAPPLEEALEADAVVVGGGMAGLAAAQWLREEAGKDVVVLEARFCGAGATGKSSGFITPDSELELTSLARRFGDADARLLWGAATRACEQIRAIVERFAIECDFLVADSLFVANGRGGQSLRWFIERSDEAA